MNLWQQLQRWRQRQTIILTDLTVRPLNFRVASQVERYRIASYGGERETLALFLSLLRPDDVVFDMGASIGLYTVAAAACLTNGRLVAFEPDPETAVALQKNVRLNKLNNVQIISWAVGAAEGTLPLYTDGVAGFAPALSRQNRPNAPQGQLVVPVRALDAALASGELPLPTVLKIDIEGAEMLCLQGSQQLLQGHWGSPPRLILLELHPLFLPELGSSAAAVRQLLAQAGYRLVWQQERDDQAHLCYLWQPEEGNP